MAQHPVAGPPLPAVLAFDVGGTRIKAGIIRGDQVLVSSITLTPMRIDADVALRTLMALGDDLVAQAPCPVAAVGVAIRGIVDVQQGVVREVNGAFAALMGAPLRTSLTEHFGKPTVIENDARMYTLGEWQYGAGQGERNLVCLTLGTGIGSGVVIEGRLLRGAYGITGILGGHVTSQADGPVCSCGALGCVEHFIGSDGLIALARREAANDPASHLSRIAAELLTPQHIFALAAQDDAAAQRVVTRFATVLGAAIVTLIHAYDPALVILGGGLSHAADQFLPEVQAYVNAHAWPARVHPIALWRAMLGDSAALIGVGAFAQDIPDRFL